MILLLRVRQVLISKMGLKFKLLLTQIFDAVVYPMGQFSRDYGNLISVNIILILLH